MAYEPVPYVRPAYEPDTRTLLQLMQMAGESRARQAGQRGQVRAQGLMTLGQILGQGLSGLRQEREQKAVNESAAAGQQRDDALKLRDQQLREADLMARLADREQTAERQAQLDAQKAGDARAKAIGYGPMNEADVDPVMQSPERAGDVRYVFGPGTAQGPELQPTAEQQRDIQTQRSIEAMGGTLGPNGQVVMPPKPERETTVSLAERAAAGDKNAARALEILLRQRAPQAQRQPIWIVGPDGQFTDLAGVAPPGSKPANTRERGRPVGSGDANRVADLDTSLDDVEVLTGILGGSGSTGTSAKVGAMLPNWLTELTGRGVSAKQKQATIDRVKQVIGKALEGGVLRKEDEKKYEKILPTIYDPPQVVQTKLAGLKAALTQRRQTLLDALSDAGYDTSRYTARETPKADDPVDALIKKYGGGS